MKKILFLITLLICFNLSAQQTDTTETKEEEKIEKFTTGDILITSGSTMIGCGIVSWFSSRRTSYTFIGVGSGLSVVGVIINLSNGKYIKKNK